MPKPKKETENPAQAAQNIKYVEPVTHFPFVYANNVTLNFGKLDASLIFGEVVGDDETDGKTAVIPKVKVVMALPFLKALTGLLNSDLVSENFQKLAAEQERQ